MKAKFAMESCKGVVMLYSKGYTVSEIHTVYMIVTRESFSYNSNYSKFVMKVLR